MLSILKPHHMTPVIYICYTKFLHQLMCKVTDSGVNFTAVTPTILENGASKLCPKISLLWRIWIWCKNATFKSGCRFTVSNGRTLYSHYRY